MLKKYYFLIYFFLFFLNSCAILNNCDQKENINKIKSLEKENKKLQEEKIKLINQNKRLKELIEKVLQRLAVIQAQYKKLIQENMELYQKLYKERMAEQRVILKEREKHMKELEKEAKELMKEVVENKEKIKKLLMERRNKLIEMNLWNIKDEKKFMEIINKLSNKKLKPEEEQKVINEALELEKEFSKRIKSSTK